MTTLVSALAIALVLASSASSSAAQNVIAGGRWNGRILDAGTHRALVGASIEIAETAPRQISDSLGRFRWASLPFGPHVIRVRLLNYQQVVDTIHVVAGDTAEHTVLLHRLPVTLNEIIVSGKSVHFPPFFEPAYKRAARGKGYFFTREDVQQWNAKDFEALLNRVPGVSANSRGVTFQRCQSGLEVLGNPALKPKVQVWIDGSRVTLGADDPSGIHNLLESVKPHMIQIMEVYPGVATIPAEFLADACAVVVIWTKRD